MVKYEKRRIRLYMSSMSDLTALRKFSKQCVFASSRVCSSGVMQTKRETPCSSSFSAPSPIFPQRHTTSLPRLRSATRQTIFPLTLCASAHPSPVIMTSAFLAASSNPTASRTVSAPEASLPPKKSIIPAPNPPAAPAPGVYATDLPTLFSTISERRRTPASRTFISSSSAPFAIRKPPPRHDCRKEGSSHRTRLLSHFRAALRQVPKGQRYLYPKDRRFWG